MSVKESRNRFLFLFLKFKKNFTIIIYKNIKIEMKDLKTKYKDVLMNI